MPPTLKGFRYVDGRSGFGDVALDGLSGLGGVRWDPAGGGDAVTWADVMTFIDASDVPIAIWLQTDGTIPPGSWDMKYSWFVNAHTFAGPGGIVHVSDGAVLRNLGKISGAIVLEGNSTSGPCVVNDALGGNPAVFVAELGATLTNLGSAPMLEAPPGSLLVFVILISGGFSTGTPGAVMAHAAAGTTLLLGCFGNCQFPDDYISGDVGANLIYQNFGGIPSPLPLIPQWLGGVFNNPLLAISNINAGDRPSSPFGPLQLGAMSFDQTLNKPIWWNGAIWVDATGAAV